MTTLERRTQAKATQQTGHGTDHDPMSHAGHLHALPADGKVINLALQGGGAHGAFTWGVLDRLLEEPKLAFEGISATSAGAMNAVVTAYGMTQGGPEAAKRALDAFWRRIAHAASQGPLQPMPWERWLSGRNLEWSPNFLAFDFMTRIFSPYQLNPANWNPLRQVLEQTVDFDALRSHRCKMKLFLTATNVKSGRIKIFDNDELSADAVLASGCLPFLFQAVEIDGEAYWDGGYMGNPAIFPLIYGCDSADVVIVHVNPIERDHVPHTASEIMNRVNEISFNSSLMREMRAVEFVTRLIEGGSLKEAELKRMRIHAIADQTSMQELSVTSKLNADWDFLQELKAKGRATAESWLNDHFKSLGKSSTLDIRQAYL